ncbi:MAG: SIS domain-containing protein [Syntrophales bacterium]
MLWAHYVDNLDVLLRSLSVRSGDGEEETDGAIALWAEKTIHVRKQLRTVFLIGNGASASMASHVAADLAKNAHVHTEVFSDLSLITAIANDMSYEEVFAEPLRRRMKNGDMLVAISSSGQSTNVLRATREAKHLGGFVVTLSAMGSENTLRGLGHLNFYVPAETYGMAETCHAAILHYWIDQMVNTVNGSGKRKSENE